MEEISDGVRDDAVEDTVGGMDETTVGGREGATVGRRDGVTVVEEGMVEIRGRE